ncbi:class I SAM-dependent methyltransferase [Nocardia sp. NPDC004604]|uniref:class I SAM-dependent methyltransferase n=1 Tax=Nocardia sp. NPDC004604 TaxID=3157013 RepID=UPI0033A96C7C
MQQIIGPESTAERVALWRALHIELDQSPHVLEDEVGLRLVDPAPGWRDRADMDPERTALSRACVTARARFVEDLVIEQAAQGVDQYVILGAGLDTFAQRRPEIAARLTVFEVDQAGPQAWKRQRLLELGFGIPEWLRLVPVDFETESWWDRLISAGFDPQRRAVVVSTGVSMYLTREANIQTLRHLATLAPGSTFVTTFQLPLELLDDEERPIRQAVENAARASGVPFLSMFRPDQLIGLAEDAGFPSAQHISTSAMTQLYFAGRTDGLRPPSAEQILVAKT